MRVALGFQQLTAPSFNSSQNVNQVKQKLYQSSPLFSHIQINSCRALLSLEPAPVTTPDDTEICQLCFGHVKATTLLEYLGLKITLNKFSNLGGIKTQLLPVQFEKMHYELVDNSSTLKSLSVEVGKKSENKSGLKSLESFPN